MRLNRRALRVRHRRTADVGADHNRARLADWKLRVAAAAAERWGGPPFRRKVHVVVTYYHEGETAHLDGDNMIKPILDALTGLIYADDRQASHIEARNVNLLAAGCLPHVSSVVAKGLARGGEFLHVWIDEER